MGDINTRPYSANYSGLVNQSVIAIGIIVLSVSSQEYMKRRRRGQVREGGLGSRESWEFGYLFQGRSWARNPSPPSPTGWPLSWVRQVLNVSEDELLRLRGIDATLYVRFLRGCFWFALLHTLTTFPILFPIHVRFSGQDVSPKSMQRASISSLVMTETGRSLLWIHICLLFWLSSTWIAMLVWLCHGAFRMRTKQLSELSERQGRPVSEEPYFPHPHPQFSFLEDPNSRPPTAEGIRHRTVMVSNVPPSLRSEKNLREYFEYFMCRKLDKPSVGLATSTQPGFLNKSFAFLFNRAKRLPAKLPNVISSTEGKEERKEEERTRDVPIIDRVVIVRKMTELANLLQRREEILRRLEVSHLKLAQRALAAVNEVIHKRQENQQLIYRPTPRASLTARARVCMHPTSIGIGQNNGGVEDCADDEQMFEQVVEALSPFVEEYGLSKPTSPAASGVFCKFYQRSTRDPDSKTQIQPPTPSNIDKTSQTTVWDALLSLPRRSLDAYQPLVNLRAYFNDKLVPSIDYYTVKLNYTTSLITEQRAKTVETFPPTSTAFVTFADPKDARKACQYLAVHPSNPLACLVTMAPEYSDLDWHRLMKASLDVEFIKDWVVHMGVWGFTIFWIFPVTFLVGLVSIQNVGLYWPRLKRYLDHHKWQLEVIQSFLPTILVALLAILIPLLLLLLAKKAHTISTLSALHDLILTRYYKFLIFNVLIIFCVGLTSLQTVLQSFKNPAKLSVTDIVSTGFPSAGPFYVGWMLFTTAMHAGVEMALFGLPLLLYPSTKRQTTPRKRSIGIRPRTLNFYYWVPNHLLVIHILLLFAVLNPFVLPFGMIYFFVNSGVIKNQLFHVYAKNYEQNGQVLLIRILRYSLDGNILSQVVFMAYMIVTKKPVNVGLAALMVVLTAIAKLVLTRICRAQFEHDDLKEAMIMCPYSAEEATEEAQSPDGRSSNEDSTGLIETAHVRSSVWSLRMSDWIGASYDTIKRRRPSPPRRPIPFRQRSGSFAQLSEPEPKDPSSSSSTLPPKPKITISPTRPRSSSHRPRTSDSRMVPVMESSEWPWKSGSLVTPHPKPVPWDDNPIYDLPYDNPYYTRAITNTLWLPRNPFGVLDLDDTVDMKMALTTMVSKGELGYWTEDVFASPLYGTLSLPSSPPFEPQISFSNSDIRSMTSRQYYGDEEIELPPVLAKRAKTIDDPDVEKLSPLRRPSVFLRAPVIPGTSQRRPSTSDTHRTGNQRFNTLRTFPSGSRMRSQSMLSCALSDSSRADLEMGICIERKPSMMLGSVGRSGGSSELGRTQPTNITALEAIVHDVMTEEEQIQAEEQEKEEQEEAKQKQSTKSWLTSWMFKRRHDTGSTEELVTS